MKRKNESKDVRSSKRRKTEKKEEEEKPRRSTRQAKKKLKEEESESEEDLSKDSENSSSSSREDEDDEEAEVYSDSASEEDDDDEEESGSAESDDSEHDSFCKHCKKAGKLLCCDGCTASWHMNCLDPPLKKIPDGKWFCPICKPEKYNMGEIDPMEGCVDKILWMRVAQKNKKKDDSNSGDVDEVDEEIEIEEDNREFHVKWKDKSYLHCEWIPEKRIKKIALQKYKNFLKNSGDDSDSDDDEQEEEGYNFGVKTDWLEPERVIDVEEKGKKKEYFVKWRDLQYEDCTWEDESVLEHYKDKIKKFQQFNDYKSVIKERKKPVKKGKFAKMTKQPAALAGGTLHDYQLEGVNWLRYSWYQDTNVILADEMGLGKTIQSISFLVSLKEENLEGPFLLVVPHSTMKNWVREFEFWAPHLNVILYWGSKDSRDTIRKHEFFFEEEANTKTKSDKTPKFNVLITSYEFILHDNSQLKPYTWQALIVDEAHRLKNNNSKLFQALTTYKTQYRVLLTGTPLQNNLQELYHLLNFLTPSKFPSLDEFEANFNNLNKEEVIAQLHALLKPRMLRRMKADVLKQLPPKKELIVGVDLSALQRQYYQAILTKNFKVLNRGLKGTAQVSLLNVLMELKKCANHPYLFPNAEPKTASDEEAIKLMVAASGKFQLLDKMLIKLKETGHRVLIFSQMTKMLDILEDYLHFKKFDYERLDGSIPADVRQERIDRFNAPNSNVFCFLLSTRAGGLGINLATADTVVIFDSDWNPHNDLQALSRCHRIGQDKKVMIYRFVTRNSVEEKILQRSKEKLMLEQLVVRKISSGKSEGSLLSQSELDEILRHGAADIFKNDDKDKDGDGLTPSSGGIYYDDDAINKLLDRSQITAADTLDNEVNNEYLQGFKVAEFGTAAPKTDKMEVDGEDAKQEKIDERDQDYWDKLLKDRFEEYEAEEEQGKEAAKRTRHARHKMQRGLSEEYWEISNKMGKKKKGEEKSSSNSDSSSSSSEEHEEEQDESYEDDGHTLVDDFDLEMQDAVIDIPGMVRKPMTVGPPSDMHGPGSPTKVNPNRPPASSMSSFTITPTAHAAPTTLTTASATAIKTAITNKKPSAPALMEGSDKGLKVLGFNAAQRKSFITMLMAFGVGDGSWGHFLSSPAKPKSLAGKSHRDLASYGSLLLMHLLEKPNDSDKFTDGVPKEGIKQSEVLQRIALLFLVRNKVLEILSGKNEFDINDGRVTNLFKSWSNSSMPWKKEHDRTLLFGVMKHGYSRWVDIALDEDLKLTKVIHDQLAYEDRVASRTPSSSGKKEQKEGENGTATSEQDGKENSEKDKDNSEKEKNKDRESDKEKDKDKPFSDVRTKKFVKRRMGLIEQALIVENQLREIQAQQPQSKSNTPNPVPHSSSIAPHTSVETTPRVSPLQSNNYVSSFTFSNTSFNNGKATTSVMPIQPATSLTSITSASLPSVSTLLNSSTSEKKTNPDIKPVISTSPAPIVPTSNLSAPVTTSTSTIPPLDTNMAFMQKFRELYAYVKSPDFMTAPNVPALNELVSQTKKYLNEL